MTLNYFDKWAVWLEPLGVTFKWIELREIPQWSDSEYAVKSTVNMLIERKIIQTQEYDQLFSDYGHIKKFLLGQPNIFDEWEKSKASIQKRWMDVFANLKKSWLSCDKFAKIIEYTMMIPGNISLL